MSIRQLLLYVFQKKDKINKKSNMLQEFITSALVIDDDFEEVKDLITYLENEKDIWAKYFSPKNIESKTIPFNNRKIIFLDLYLDDSRSCTDNIAIIRKYFKTIIGKEFGSYGIVLWTKHTNHFDEFCDKIFQKNNPFTLPLFVIPLDKTTYKRKGNYNGVLEELESKLAINISSSFFVEWNKAVKKGSDYTINSLYNLFETNVNKDKYLEAILYKLACNYTGIPEDNDEKYDLQKDLIKSLMDSLQFEISNNYQNVENLFKIKQNLIFSVEQNDKEVVYSKINSLLLLDFHNISNKIVIPGNIYEVINNRDSIYFDSFYTNKGVEIKIDEHPDFIEIDNEGRPVKCLINKRIAIEITPPCDFASKKKQFQSRIIGGILMDYNKTLKEKYFKSESYYSFLYPINIEGIEKPQMIIFDFYRFQTINEELLKNDEYYKIFMKAKDKLFADILQKFSSHSARLGIAIIN